ncbi:MAG: hypothetical protein ABH875_06440 [Candidatus Omnitrophota bacterium]
MKNSIKNQWLDTFDLLAKNPIIFTPFVVTALFEAMAMLFLYYLPRNPLMYIFNPIISKLYGEVFTHYPGCMLMFTKFFFYARMSIFIFIGAFMAAVAVNMFKAARLGHTVNTNTAFKNASKRYVSLLGYGVIAAVIVMLIKRVDFFILRGLFSLVLGHAPGTAAEWFSLVTQIFFFLSVIVFQVFFVATIPIIVLKNKRLFKAVMESVYLGARNFFGIFALIFLPYLIYLPLALVRSTPLKLIEMTFPEINMIISVIDVLVAIVIDCFIIIGVSRFLLEETGGNKI